MSWGLVGCKAAYRCSMIKKAAKSNVMFNNIIFNLTIQQADFFLISCILPYVVKV